MRLTLRTLLAYLDDRLPPGAAKEIGQKVTTSPFATELAERIRSVVRRRRLAKESVGQKSIDANLIAEYLDDQLTPELVALIERQILSSDATLAEVAATHQIIGTLKDPVELGGSLKGRLYRLGPQPDAEEQDAEVAASDSGWKPLEAQAVRQKRSPMLLLGAMTLGWLALVATDSNLFQSKTSPAPNSDAEVLAQGDPDVEVGEVAEPADVVKPNERDMANMEVVANANGTDAQQAQLVDAGSGNVNLPSSGPGLATPPAQTSDSTTPRKPAADPVAVTGAGGEMNATDTTASDSDPAMVPDTASAASDTGAAVNSEQTTSPAVADNSPAPIDLVDRYAMAVLLADDSTAWTWAANSNVDTTSPAWESEGRWTGPMANSVFGIPAPFDVQLLSPELGWQVMLHGASLFRAAADGSIIEIIDGELMLQQLDMGSPPKAFTVSGGGDSFQIAVPELSRKVGVSVRPLPINLADSTESVEPTSFLPIGQNCLITVYAADAPATVKIGDDEISVAMGMQLQWQSGSDVLPTPESSILPDWIFDITKPKTDSTNELLAATATAFRSSQSVETAADSLLENRNPLMAGYSVNLPGLIRQLSLLSGTLLETEDSTVRKATITQLQYIQQTSPGAKERITELLRSRLPEADTENAMKLLSGISPVAAEDRSESAWLVGMLSHARAPLRGLAIYNLEQLTGQTETYMADDEPGRRSGAVRRWNRLLSRNDGRILPASE